MHCHAYDDLLLRRSISCYNMLHPMFQITGCAAPTCSQLALICNTQCMHHVATRLMPALCLVVGYPNLQLSCRTMNECAMGSTFAEPALRSLRSGKMFAYRTVPSPPGQSN